MKDVPIVQGDVMLMPVDGIPQGDVQQPDAHRGGHVLAEGEVTGHAHVLDRATLTIADGVRYVDVKAGAALRHEDHGTVAVPAGAYRVLRQTEPDIVTGVQRNVAD